MHWDLLIYYFPNILTQGFIENTPKQIQIIRKYQKFLEIMQIWSFSCQE
jgi:hypothetical protein